MDLRLTPSQENYLEHIWHLSDKGSVRTTDIADSAGVKRPSVTRAVNNLASIGLVKHEHYGEIELTAKGDRVAKYIIRRDRSLRRFLTRILQLDSKKVDSEVCRLEHVVSADVLGRLDILSKYLCHHAQLLKGINREMRQFSQPSEPRLTIRVGTKPHV